MPIPFADRVCYGSMAWCTEIFRHLYAATYPHIRTICHWKSLEESEILQWFGDLIDYIDYLVAKMKSRLKGNTVLPSARCG